MSVLLHALYNLSLINPCFLSACDNAIGPGSSALRPVRLSRSAVCTVQWAPVDVPCWWTPPWQPGRPPLTSGLGCGLWWRRKINGSCLNSALESGGDWGGYYILKRKRTSLGFLEWQRSSANGGTSLERDGLCNGTWDIWLMSKWGA